MSHANTATAPAAPLEQAGEPLLRQKPLGELRLRHQTLLMWMLSHPMATYVEAADALGYSREWVGLVARSDMFKAELNKAIAESKQKIIDDLPARIAGAASLALDKTVERLKSNAASERFISESSNNLLRMLGYGQPTKAAEPEQRHVHLHVTREDIENARSLRSQAPAKLPSGEPAAVGQLVALGSDRGQSE
jgi:hypothetical protein